MQPPKRNMSLVPNVYTTSKHKRSNKIFINVGGIRHETYVSTLRNIPDTKLAWLTESGNNSDYDEESGEYFFDRHPGMFLMILNYYRTGRLHAPMEVCGPMFEEELAFWGIDEQQIEPCCWQTYRTHRDAQETLAEFDGGHFLADEDVDDLHSIARRFGIAEDTPPDETCWQRWSLKVWRTLEEPASCISATIFAGVSFVFVIASILSFCLETVYELRVPIRDNYTLQADDTVSAILANTAPHPALLLTEYVTSAYFTLEILIRLLVCPHKIGYFKKVLNWIDILSLVPFYIYNIAISQTNNDSLGLRNTFNTLRMIRIFRIFKLTRHLSGLRVLLYTLKASLKELFLLFIFVLTGVLIYGTFIYYMEQIREDRMNKFKNIPVGFWWALVTMTTIGYGDVVPRTGLGYVVGTFTAITGVLVIALPVPVIVNNFALYYSHAQARMKLPKKRRRYLSSANDQLKTRHQQNDLDIQNSAEKISPRIENNIPTVNVCDDEKTKTTVTCLNIVKDDPHIRVEYTDVDDDLTSDNSGGYTNNGFSDLGEVPTSTTSTSSSTSTIWTTSSTQPTSHIPSTSTPISIPTWTVHDFDKCEKRNSIRNNQIPSTKYSSNNGRWLTPDRALPERVVFEPVVDT